MNVKMKRSANARLQDFIFSRLNVKGQQSTQKNVKGTAIKQPPKHQRAESSDEGSCSAFDEAPSSDEETDDEETRSAFETFKLSSIKKKNLRDSIDTEIENNYLVEKSEYRRGSVLMYDVRCEFCSLSTYRKCFDT